MMRPMKLAGSELVFGEGCLEYIKTIPEKKVAIVLGGKSMEKTGILKKVEDLFKENGAETTVICGVEPEPHFATVLRGANEMKAFQPDLIVALGGGSVMDAAKTMWVYYEHEELTKLEDVMPPNKFPKLRSKSKFCCIPSTSGTASEVSRSVVISDEAGIKHGLGNMEMMPDIAICDPLVTVSMPPHVTAETGLDALTHALEALVSNRANYLSDILAKQAVKDIIAYLPKAYDDGKNMEAREYMINASMVAGLAFTNVSLGIVHSMAHTIGSYFGVSHGLGDAVILPYIIAYNMANEEAKEKYSNMANELHENDEMDEVVRVLNQKVGIASCLKEVINDEKKYLDQIEDMAKMALADGCTKTNPIIPSLDEMKELFKQVYFGK